MSFFKLEANKESDLVDSLPKPLFFLYSQLLAYSNAYNDDALTYNIVGKVDPRFTIPDFTQYNNDEKLVHIYDVHPLSVKLNFALGN